MNTRKRKLAAVVVGLGILTMSTAGWCDNKRQIDRDRTGSWSIPGTSWYGFCDGPNAFIWVPSRSDTDPDELEAVIYDHPKCVTDINPAPSGSSKPDTDPDGIVDDED